MIKRINKACSYFPCHNDLEDCTFCHCPFYPCRQEALGWYVYSRKLKRRIWSCQDCNWIHQKETVERIYCLIRKHGSELRKDIPAAKPERQWFGVQYSQSHKANPVRNYSATQKKQDVSNGAKKKTLLDKQTGVVILGHGSRLKKANALISNIIGGLKQSSGLLKVYPAYLQLAKPDLVQSLERLAKSGCRRIIIIPFFLFVGNHVSRDIPEIIEQEKKKYPDVRFIYTENLGKDSRIADIVADKIKENLNETDK